MTREELKMHHYNMWNFIVETIIETNGVVNIDECKQKYCESVGLFPKHFCFMCEFAYSKTNNDSPITCDHCPSVLELGDVISAVVYQTYLAFAVVHQRYTHTPCFSRSNSLFVERLIREEVHHHDN